MAANFAFPMYDVHPAATDALVSALLRDFPEARFQRPTDLLSHWRDESLLLSQTCGYPLMTQLPEVQVVGQFHYTAPGCVEGNYRSLLVVREEEKGKTLWDFHGRVAVSNSPDSQSGYHALRNSVKHDDAFFSAVHWTGSHRLSLSALQRRTADIAAIDNVSFALFARYEPEALAGLTVIGETALTPGLPLITSRHTSAETIARLRAALSQIAGEKNVAEPLLIGGFRPASRRDYEVILTASSYA
ncbi:phosphate ABC transporter substrate-binding protein [Enterobacteriaceae bacterium 89]|nr:phosphate ABC transporter substrate-binding protein [Enterobacteriaceae bacterium 89]